MSTTRPLKEDLMKYPVEVQRRLKAVKDLLKEILSDLDTKESTCPTCSLRHKNSLVESRAAKRVEGMITNINSLIEDLKL
jgi:hypothetical protein